MATLPHNVCNSTFPFRAGRIVFGVLLAGLSAGCAQRVYLAKDLPPQYRAPAKENIAEIDLSGLTNYSISSEIIGCGDVLNVTVVTDYNARDATTTPVRVRDDGMVDVPLIRAVPVAGLELEEAERAIESAGIARGIFQKPHVTVTMERRCTNEALIIGAVKKSGRHKIPRNASSLLAALAAAGLTKEASGEVEIRRRPTRRGLPGSPPMPRIAGPDDANSESANPDDTELASYVVPEPETVPAPMVTRVNLARAAAEGDTERYLEDGDEVIVLKQVPKPVYVTGLVRKPNEYELSPNKDMYLLDVMALAGERSIPLADKVMIIRRIPGEEEPIRIKVSIREAQANDASNVRLMPGDNIHFADTPATVVMRTLTDVLRVGVGSSVPLY